MKKFLSMLIVALVATVGILVPGVAQADDPNTEYPSCQININEPATFTGYYFVDAGTSLSYSIYRLPSQATGFSSSACEDINFTPLHAGDLLWDVRTFARVYVCPVGGCYWSSWVLIGPWGGVIMPGVPDNMWYYIEFASRGNPSSPLAHNKVWD